MSAIKRLLVGADAPASGVLSRTEAEALVERVVGLSTADEVEVNFQSGHQRNTRFAANQMSTAGSIANTSVIVQSSFGRRSAVVQTNDLSPESLARAVRESEALAKLSPENPEAMPRLGAQTYVPVSAYAESVAGLTPADHAQAALTALRVTRGSGDLQAAGFLVTGASVQGLGNGKGLFAYHPSTSVNYTLTVRTADGTGSGWAAADEPDWANVDFAAISNRAIEKARASRTPVAIEPGRYTVILEPQAVGDLVQLIGGYADARLADEGRSPFAKQGGGNKIGERIVDPRISMYSDPADPQLLSAPFDGEGMPLGRQEWIRDGVLQQLAYGRFWAQKQGKAPTGQPNSLKMTGGDATIEQMIASTPRGILVTRLWYLREVDPRTILYTGLTRDGTFLVENGKISRAVQNFRFNDSPLFMLNNLEMLGRPVRLAGTEAGGAVVMPAIKVRDFNFTSLSEAV